MRGRRSCREYDALEMEEPTWYRNLKGIGCGTTAGVVVTLVGHPFDTLKVRLQTQSSLTPVYKGTVDCVSKTLKWEGISGLYKGVASPIVGQVLFRTTLFTSFYEATHYLKQRLTPGSVLLPRDYFISGAITGFLGSFSDAPIELFKSKIQIQIIAEKLELPVSVRYMGVGHCLRHTLTNYGVRGIYQGLGPTLVRDCCGYCVYFGSFEYIKKLLTPTGPGSSDLSMLRIMLAGGLAGVLFWSLVFNVDVIKSAMMGDEMDRSRRKYKNMVDCAIKLYRHEGGYRRFWKGFTPCILRSFPANALMLYVVDLTRRWFPAYNSDLT